MTPAPAKGQTAWTETVLYSFAGGSAGAGPFYGGLLADKRGALYGTTFGGGTAGTVFKLMPPPPRARPLGQRPCSIVSLAVPMAATPTLA